MFPLRLRKRRKSLMRTAGQKSEPRYCHFRFPSFEDLRAGRASGQKIPLHYPGENGVLARFFAPKRGNLLNFREIFRESRVSPKKFGALELYQSDITGDESMEKVAACDVHRTGMKNPYSVLGAQPNAEAQQLREAYQALAQLHEGDARRMRKIDDAYDAILLSRGAGDEAFALLESVPEDRRGSEWHYRMGCVQRGRGWLAEAEARFAHAALFDPDNKKYQAALKRARGGRSPRSNKNSASSFCGGSEDDCVQCCCECFCNFI